MTASTDDDDSDYDWPAIEALRAMGERLAIADGFVVLDIATLNKDETMFYLGSPPSRLLLDHGVAKLCLSTPHAAEGLIRCELANIRKRYA